MFTGLIEEMGTLLDRSMTEGGATLTIEAAKVLEGVAFGDSIAVEGVCLSVTSFTPSQFTVGLAPETLSRTTLGALPIGAPLNLERSLTPVSRMGGHYVQGHVDGTGCIHTVKADGDALLIRIDCGPELLKYIVPKGYIAVDGTSLTVIDVDDAGFTLTLIAHTQPLVTLGKKREGDPVNLETDILGKYAEKFLQGGKQP